MLLSGSRLGNGTERGISLVKEKSEEGEECIFSVKGLLKCFCFCELKESRVQSVAVFLLGLLRVERNCLSRQTLV